MKENYDREAAGREQVGRLGPELSSNSLVKSLCLLTDGTADTRLQTQDTIEIAKVSRATDGKDRVCKCGRTIDEIFIGSRCLQCRRELERVEWRRRRKEKQCELLRRLQRVIPPLFEKAHLRDLSAEFRKRLFGFNKKAGIVFYGPAGVGKSHTLAAMARCCILNGLSCIRTTYEEICLSVRDTYRPNSPKTELDIIRPLINCDRLFIEDVGSMTSIGRIETEFSVGILFLILDSRLEQCKPTFISTNKTKENLAKSFDERIDSRLSLFTWIGVGGEDRRIRPKTPNKT